MNRPATNAGKPFARVEGVSTLGKRLKSERLLRGLTILRLSGMTGIDQSVISHIENRPVDPKLSTAVKLAKALDCSVDYLCGLED